ncbi:GAF and ANTAR domain-containing protein [Mycobacterium sp. MFM001]|uniref:GAF and ANTAR domain-containing protein n=1 Tax=Mycobacterium sp. MFM001 TaxID=2049453 RepID=UPI000E2EA94E
MQALSGHDVAQRMAELARSVAAPAKVEDVLATVTGTAVELLPGADTAGVLLVSKGGKFESLFGTSELIYKLDELQAKYNQGPCVDAAHDDLMLRADDFTIETRWPDFSRALAEIGVRSCLSFKLYAGDRTAGALNVFGLKAHAFTAESEALGSVLAAHAAAAILASRHSEQLRSAINSRDVIGQAKGVLMERFNIDALRAFEMLRKLSQDTNVKLAELAQRVVDTRGT